MLCTEFQFHIYNTKFQYKPCNVFICLGNSLLQLFLTRWRTNNDISDKTSKKPAVQERNFLQDVLRVVQNLVITIFDLIKTESEFQQKPHMDASTKCNVFSAWCTVFFQLFLSKKEQKVRFWDTNSGRTPCGNF